jgi:hypothetical protein
MSENYIDWSLVEKVKSVINSCKTEEQIQSAVTYGELAAKRVVKGPRGIEFVARVDYLYRLYFRLLDQFEEVRRKELNLSEE